MPDKSIPTPSEAFRSKSATGDGEGWMARAKSLRLKINFAWWLQSAIPWWLSLVLLGAVGVLLIRTKFTEVPLEAITYGTLALTVIAAVIAYFRSRKYFVSLESALARIDDTQKLHNALTTAHAGIGAWPAPSREQSPTVEWRGGRLSSILLAPLAIFLLAAWLPIDTPSVDPQASHRPAIWDQIQSTLMEKAVQELADPERIEAMQREMEKLADRAPGDWFDHQSLQTSDQISELLSAGLENMEQNLSLAANLAPKLAEQMGDNPPLDDQTREELARQMEQALQQLENQPIGLNEEARKKLMEAAPEILKNLDPQQAKELADQLKEWAEQAGEARREMGEGGKPGDKPLWEQLLDGDKGNGLGEGEEQPGNGGIQRGPGDAPLTLKPDESNIIPNRPEGVQGDGNQLQPGEKIGETLDNREVERTQIGSRAGGSADQQGQGGDRVWRQQLTPSEQSLLENYFD